MDFTFSCTVLVTEMKYYEKIPYSEKNIYKIFMKTYVLFIV